MAIALALPVPKSIPMTYDSIVFFLNIKKKGHLYGSYRCPFFFILRKKTMESYVIGIDLGTGSAKAIAMTHAGEVIDTVQILYPTLHPKPGFQEQAPELI